MESGCSSTQIWHHRFWPMAIWLSSDVSPFLGRKMLKLLNLFRDMQESPATQTGTPTGTPPDDPGSGWQMRFNQLQEVEDIKRVFSARRGCLMMPPSCGFLGKSWGDAFSIGEESKSWRLNWLNLTFVWRVWHGIRKWVYGIVNYGAKEAFLNVDGRKRSATCSVSNTFKKIKH